MNKTLRSLSAALLLTLCYGAGFIACGGGDDSASSDDLSASKRKCTSDAGCYNGYVCVSGYCQKPGTPPPPPPACTSNASCSSGQVCVSGVCQACTTDTQCGAGLVCTSGKCTTPAPPPPPPPPPGCTSNASCSNGQVCVSGTCEACTTDSQCDAGLVCTNGACGTKVTPPPPPPPPPGACVTEQDCANGGLCESGSCVAMACAHRASTKTGIRATVLITRYQGLIHGFNGDHEVAFGTLSQVEWIHDPALEDTKNVQLALNVSSSKDPSGLPHEIVLSAGQTIDLEGEYITAASANASGNAVIHFTHSTCGYVTIAGTTYQ